ncbi:MAG: T9SS type A sorting domain-containing protein [Bacteroidales bacterium]|nr:T9SS type A sorting domain-containing protein [Bacteroidales bacterium]
MKKLFALIAVVLCFSAANAQTVKYLLYMQNNTPYAFDSLKFENIDPSKKYNFPLYMVVKNNTQDTFAIGDTIQVQFALNSQPIDLSLTMQKEFLPDSGIMLNLSSLTINGQAFKSGEYANTICAKVTKVYTKGAYSDVTDEGFCGVFTTKFNVNVAEAEMEAIRIYPNPVRNNLSIENANNVTVNVYAANGQLVKTAYVNGNANINMSELSNGLYIVKMQNEQATRVEKIQVIR